MKILLDYGLAWISILFVIILAAKFYVRKGAQSQGSLRPAMVWLNKSMKKSHIIIGVLLIVTGFLHGYFSSTSIWSVNIGTISWVVSILLGINFMFKKKMKNKGGWIYYHRVLTVIFITTIVCHVVEVGGIKVFDVLSNPNAIIESRNETSLNNSDGNFSNKSQNSKDKQNNDNNAQNSAEQNNSNNSLNGSVENYNKNLMGVVLKDGVYTGEATGFRPGLTVEVKVKNNKITDIKITGHNEKNSRFYSTPIKQIPKEIIEAQSLDVDTVSGATFTSTGIINAVNAALSKALVSGTLPEMKTLPQGRGH